jgi:phosphoribosyl-AMP cyclohydrolase
VAYIALFNSITEFPLYLTAHIYIAIKNRLEVIIGNGSAQFKDPAVKCCTFCTEKSLNEALQAASSYYIYSSRALCWSKQSSSHHA